MPKPEKDERRRGSAVGTPSDAPCADLGLSPAVKRRIEKYIELCKEYNAKPNGSFLVVLRTGLPVLKFTSEDGILHEDQLLPICDLYLENPKESGAYFPKRWDFSGCTIASNGVALVANLLRAHLPMEALSMHRCKIGPRGFDYIAEVLESPGGVSRTLRVLDMGENLCYLRSATRFAQALALGRHSLTFVDASNCRLTFAGVKAFERAAEGLNGEGGRRGTERELSLELYGNLIMDELWNSITHGVGLLLAIVGGVVMECTYWNTSPYHRYGTLVFSACMVILYASSMFYHTFFKLLPVKRVFHRCDRFSIFFLIAGTYTPICLVTLHGRVGYATTAAVWALAAMGILVNIFYFGRFEAFNISLYLGMGWLVAAIAVPLATHPHLPITPGTYAWIVAGGLSYTIGVYFLTHDELYTMYHAYWHLLVLFGTICHYIAIYFFLMPAGFPEIPVDKYYYPPDFAQKLAPQSI